MTTIGLLAIILTSLSLNPSMYLDINNNEITTVKNQLIDIIFGKMTPFHIPDISYQIVHLKNMTLMLTGFVPSALTISLPEGTSNILIQGTNVGFYAIGNVTVDAGNISTGINITAVKMGANITISLGIDTNMKPIAIVSNLNLSVLPDNMQILFTGNMASWIVSLVVAAIKAFFMSNILQEIQKAIPPPINDAMAAILSKVPTNISLGKIEILDELTSSPYIKGGNLIFPLITQIKDEAIIPFTPPVIPEYDNTCAKGVQIVLGDYIFNDMMYMAFQTGIMHAKFNSKIFGLPFAFDCGLTNYPNITFNQAITTSIAGRCGFKLGFFSLGFLSTAHLSVSSKIDNKTMSFAVDAISVDSLKLDMSGTPNLMWLINVLNPMFNKLVGKMNELLANNTITIPDIPGITLSETEESVKNGYISLCSVINIDLT